MNYNSELLMTLTNFIYLTVAIIAVVIVLSIFSKKEKKRRNISEIDMYKMQLKRRKRQLKDGPISNYLNNLDEYFASKNPENPEKAGKSVNLIIITSVIIVVSILYFSNIAFAGMAFLLFHFLISVAVKDSGHDEYKKSEYKLPEVIDVLIRSFSKSDDLKTIIFETSTNAPQPYSSMFGEMARIMTSSGQVEVLNTYIKRSKSVWMHSLFSILIRYKEDAKKEDIIQNLKHLRSMIDQENQLKRSLMGDKRYNVVLNYIFAVVSVVGNIILFIFFPDISKTAYFGSPIGMLMLIGGYLCVLAIHILTKKMSNKSEIDIGDK